MWILLNIGRERFCVSLFVTHVYPGTKSTLVSHAVSVLGSVECYIKDDLLFVILFTSSNVCPGAKPAMVSHQRDVGVVHQCFT